MNKTRNVVNLIMTGYNVSKCLELIRFIVILHFICWDDCNVKQTVASGKNSFRALLINVSSNG